MGVQSFNTPYEIELNTVNDEPVSIIINSENHVIYDSQIHLAQIPDEFYRVVITEMTEINIKDDISSATEFKVDYKHGAIYFDQSLEGASVTIGSYYGKGFKLVYADRIIGGMLYDGSYVTLQEMIDEQFVGVSLEFLWDGTELGIKREDEADYTYVDLKGIQGETGNGITSIIRTSGTGAEGTIDTYTITYTDTTTSTFQIYNGEDGADFQYIWDGTQLGIKTDEETTYTYTDLQGDGLIWRGVYNSSTTYYMNDLVKNNSIIYICLGETTGNNTDNLTYWNEFILVGANIIKEEEFTATDGQTVFTLTSGSYAPNENKINVYLWGTKQPDSSFVQTSSTSITFDNGLAVGDKLLIEWFEIDPILKGDAGVSGNGIDTVVRTSGDGSEGTTDTYTITFTDTTTTLFKFTMELMEQRVI